MVYRTLYILVEGETEFAVVKSFLQPYWKQRFIKCQVVNYKGSGNLKAKYVKEIERILSKPDDAALVLIDIKEDPFGVQSNSSTHSDAYHTLQKLLYTGLGMSESASLGIFPVVVEPETWLLADPTIQKDYFQKTYTHPENETNAAVIVEKHIKGYRKGVSAKKFFDKASAVHVYADNCPHFVFLADWLAGRLPTPQIDELPSDIEQRNEKTRELYEKYDGLWENIEKQLNQGKNETAEELFNELIEIEKQINELWIAPSRNEDSQ